LEHSAYSTDAMFSDYPSSQTKQDLGGHKL